VAIFVPLQKKNTGKEEKQNTEELLHEQCNRMKCKKKEKKENKQGFVSLRGFGMLSRNMDSPLQSIIIYIKKKKKLNMWTLLTLARENLATENVGTGIFI